jgi:hypothetical protein
MRGSTALFPVALGAVIVASPVRAQDAQNTGPIKITQCQTINQPGSYKLADNLTFTSTTGTCLSITASYVTIDLAGFSISGPATSGPFQPTPTAIGAGENTTGIAVRNGSISGFGSGVELIGSGSIVERLRVFNGVLSGIHAVGIVKGNTVVGIAGGPGQGVGILATGIVTDNYVNETRLFGIGIGQGSTVIGNTSTNSFDPGIGISVDCPSNVTNNTAVNNRSANLILNGNGCNNTNNVVPGS